MSRPLLIGQAPGPNTNPDLPLFPVPKTSAGGRLQHLMGLTRAEYMQLFERTNLLHEFPGRHKRDDKFPMAKARLAASTIRPLLTGRRVVLVGRNVANAFDLGEMQFHRWQSVRARRACIISGCDGMTMLAVVPHPSGRNHWYNSQGNRDEAARFWQELINDLSG